MARSAPKPRSLLPLLVLAIISLLDQQVQYASACPFANAKGMMHAMPHLRKILSNDDAESDGYSAVSQDETGSAKGYQNPKGTLPPPACKKSHKTFSKCDDLAGYGPYSPTFYEDKGCTGGKGLWGTIVKALTDFDQGSKLGSTFVSDCLAPMIRNVFHMDIGLGHNARLFLEDWGNSSNPRTSPDANPDTSRSAKMAVPNLTLRCFDVYEYLREKVDKYTAKHCPKVYVSCTDLANYAAKFAHWKLSNHKFLPCFNFGFADAEPQDFAGDAFHKGLSPRDAVQTCMPPRDGTDVFGPSMPVEEALSKENFDTFFTAAMHTFSKPCYPTPRPMSNKDLSSILLGHTVGQAHCALLKLDVKEPYMDNTFFKKLAADCNRCRTAVATNTAIPPYGDFQSNLNSDSYSFAQQCKRSGMVDYLPAGKATELNRMESLFADPCCIPNDVFTGDQFDFQYFPQVVNGYGLLEVDNGLAVHRTTKERTEEYSHCRNSHKMLEDYQRAWNKMNLIGAKRYDGKRRQYCSVPSWATATA